VQQHRKQIVHAAANEW